MSIKLANITVRPDQVLIARNRVARATPLVKATVYDDFLVAKGISDSAGAVIIYAYNCILTGQKITFTDTSGAKKEYANLLRSDIAGANATGIAYVYAQVADIDLFLLVASSQVTRLSGDNVHNYFAMKDLDIPGDLIAAFINDVSGEIENLTEAKEVSTAIANIDWVRYRMTAASGIGLVMRAIDAFPAAFTVQEIQDVKDYMANPVKADLARKVSESAKAKAYILHDVFGTLPSNWYQGEKAFASYPVTKAAAFRAAVKALRDLEKSSEEFTQANTVDEVNALASKKFAI